MTEEAMRKNSAAKEFRKKLREEAEKLAAKPKRRGMSRRGKISIRVQ